MSSKENIASAKTSSHSRQSTDKDNKPKADHHLVKKRTSSAEPTNLRNSLHHLQESIQAINFPYPISLEECRGIDDVLITPSYMEFKDGSEGNVMQQTMTIRNVGTRAAIVRVHKPNSMIFQIEHHPSQERKLYPGLSLTARVRYSFRQSSSLHAMIPIEINGTTLDYHLICTFSTPHLVAEPATLDFGCINVDSVSDVKTLAIRNTGGKTARFSVDLGTNHLISIRPDRGLVKPNGKILLKVQLTGRYEGLFDASVWIKSNPIIGISVKVKIIKPKLLVDCFAKVNESVLINFPATYLQTRGHRSFTLKNNSAQAATFVLLAKDRQGFQLISEIDADKNASLGAFKITPSAGRLRPFEETPLSISFCPTFNELQLLRNTQQDQSANHFVAVIKISKIAAAEAKAVLKMRPKNAKIVEQNIPQICPSDQLAKGMANGMQVDDETEGALDTTLYLHGEIEMPCLKFQPDELRWNDLNVDDRAEQFVRITNPSGHLPLKFTFVAKPWIRCHPSQALLEPKQSVRVLVGVRAQFNLEAVFHLEFDAWASSVDGSDFGKSRSVIVGRLSLGCAYNPLRAPARVASCRKMCKVASLSKLPSERDYSPTRAPSQVRARAKRREYRAHRLRATFSPGVPSDPSDAFDHADPRRRGDGSVATAAPKPRLASAKAPTSSGHRASRRLSALQLFKVRVSPLKLDFGQMARHSESLRRITVENGNAFEITIGLVSLDESVVAFPDGTRFTLEPQSSAARSVAFRAQHFGKFSSYLNYTINQEHEYQLPVVASVVFKRLKLRTKEVVFERDCHPLEACRLPFKFVEIENELNADTTFKWIVPEKCNFWIEPEQGSVPANRKLYVGVYQQLDASKSNRIEAAIQDEDEACLSLRVEAALRAPNVALIDDCSDLGQIPLNLARRARTVLYNAEYFGVFFQVDQGSLVKGVAVSPARGSIPPRGIAVLTARLLFDACVEGSTRISVLVQKRLSLHWNLKFAVVFPKLRFEPNVVDWKRVCVNSHRVQAVLATNLSDAELVVNFPSGDRAELGVSASPSKSCIPIARGDNCFRIRPKSTVRLFVHFVPCDVARYSIRLPLVINGLLGPASIEDADDARAAPFLQTSHQYYSNVKGLSLVATPAELPSIRVRSIVTQPVVCFNKLAFRFTDSFRQDKWKCRNNCQRDVTLTLLTGCASQLDRFPFTICWLSGAKATVGDDCIEVSLKPEQDVHFRIGFEPTEPSQFAFELPISLDHAGTRQTYNKLTLDGLHSEASIETDVLELNLTPVPLETVSRQTFHLRVCNFTQPSLLCFRIRSPEKSSRATEIDRLLTVIFPRGNAIKSYCSHCVQVEIQFASAASVGFCTRVIFFDRLKLSSISIDVSATADNSLLSTHAYDNGHRKSVLVIKGPMNAERAADLSGPPAQPEAFSENVQARSIVSVDKRRTFNPERGSERLESASYCEAASNLSKDSFVDSYATIDGTASEEETSYLQVVGQAVERWLYGEVLSYEFNPSLLDGVSLTLLGSKLLETTAKNDKNKEQPKLCTYIDIFERLSKASRVLPYSDRTWTASESLGVDPLGTPRAIMRFLLSQGAFIAHLSVEHLLDYNEYKELVADANYTLDEDAFRFRSQRAWLDLLLQSYKAFAMAQINEEYLAKHAQLLDHAKSIDSSPNVSHAIDLDDIANRSKRHHRMAGSEALLLAWLEFNNALHFEARPIDQFGKCLADSLAFIAVTLNYCPFLADFFANVYVDPTADDQKTHNATCLLLAWAKIRLGFTLTPSQMVDANAVQMLMLSRHLFKYLPTYLIKSKVTIACPLTQSTSTQIRLSTDSNHQISYVVQFIGNDLDAFASKAILSIYPHKSQQIKAKNQRRYTRLLSVHWQLTFTAYLVLCGSTIGPHFAENQVFLLEGFPDELDISQSFSFTTKLYQIVQKNLTISVPYDNPKEYEIWISGERPSSIDQLAMTKWESARSSRYALNRLTFQDTNISIEEQSQVANFTITLACLTCESQSFWIIFRSTLADFIIQITSNYRISITDNISIKMAKGSCICPDLPLRVHFACPLVYKLFIPSENVQMNRCILKLFKNSLADQDRHFWTSYLDNTIGLRFIKWLIKNSSCSATDDLINFKQTYNITTDTNSLLLQLDNVRDDRGNDQMELTIHTCGELADVGQTLITLTSWDKREIRICQVDFLGDESSAGSLQSMSKK